MKKIISTLALATLAFGSVFADVTFTTNYKTKMVGFSRVMSKNSWKPNGGNGPETPASSNDDAYNSYLLKHGAYAESSDDFKIAVSNDFGGAAVRVDPNLKAEGSADDTNNNLVEYYGYATLGSIKLTAGLIDGINNGDYRLTGEIGKANLEAMDAYNPGSMHKNAISFKADDIAYFDGDNRPVGMITYKGEFGDTVLTADLVAAAIDNTNKDTAWDGSKMHSALGARVDVKLPFAGMQFVFKQHTNTKTEAKRSVAFHVAPVLGEDLNLVLGGATGFYNGELTEFNADIRFMFKSGNISITSLNTIGYIRNAAVEYMNDGGNPKKLKLGYGSHIGLNYLKSDGTMGSVANTESQSSMWNVIGFRMEASEKLAVFCNAGDIIGFNAGGKEIGDFGMELFVAPGVQLYATKNCSVTAAARVGISNLLMDNDEYDGIKPVYGILIPVVMRVQL